MKGSKSNDTEPVVYQPLSFYIFLKSGVVIQPQKVSSLANILSYEYWFLAM